MTYAYYDLSHVTEVLLLFHDLRRPESTASNIDSFYQKMKTVSDLIKTSGADPTNAFFRGYFQDEFHGLEAELKNPEDIWIAKHFMDCKGKINHINNGIIRRMRDFLL